jgi:spectinomycin phosphotransferase
VRLEDTAIDTSHLRGLIEQAYGIEIQTMEYIPLGECSHDYWIRTAPGDDLFVKIHTHTPSERSRWDRALLEHRLQAVAAIHDECGVEAVVSPLRTRAGALTVEHAAGPLAVFPRISGDWVAEQGRSRTDTHAVGRIVGAVHACPAPKVFGIERDLIETFEISYAATLRSLLTEGIESVEDDPSFPTRALLGRHRDEILNALSRLEASGEKLRGSRDGWVPTHGDPTQGNILKRPDGHLHLVDWDGIVLGPPERDLVFFGGSSFDVFMDGYRDSRPVPPIRADLVSFYLYHWDLQEIADWGWRLLHLGADDQDRVHAWRELTQYLPVRNQRTAEMAQEMKLAAGH